MICVKSYAADKDGDGTDARMRAEALASEIREKYRVPAYLFERGAAEREAENQRHAKDLAAKKAAQAKEAEEWEKLQAKLKADAAAKGMEFLESKREVKAAKIDYSVQYAVLIGGWPDMASARREMEKVRRWEAPSNRKLMDTQFIVREKDGQRQGEYAFVNPFQQCMVVPNPVAPRTADPEGEADAKLVLKMNSDEEYSVLKCQKKWTIAAKFYAPPLEVKGKDERTWVQKVFAKKPEDAMNAAGDQARDMAKVLRSMKPTAANQFGPFEAYVLHTKYGSMLCVGQFDGPDDPELLKIQDQLGKMTFTIAAKPSAGLTTDQHNVRAFDRLYAMKIRD
jgi:hypothetical protein